MLNISQIYDNYCNTLNDWENKGIEKIEYNPKNEEYVLDLMIHMGCMLDRCLSKIDIKYNNLN